MREITLDRLQLLNRVKANYVQHQQDYKDAVAGWANHTIAALQGRLDHVKADPLGSIQKARFGSGCNCAWGEPNPPDNWASSYEKAIEMLEAGCGMTVTLSEEDFNQLWKNNWSWTGAFNAQYTSYTGKAK